MPEADIAFLADIHRAATVLLGLAANPLVDEKNVVILKAAANIACEEAVRIFDAPDVRPGLRLVVE